jgi:Anti-sigma factor NepR
MTTKHSGDGANVPRTSTSPTGNEGENTPVTEELLPPPILDSGVQGHIGRQLRAHYSALVAEQVPDQLLKLLDDLARIEVPPKKDHPS